MPGGSQSLLSQQTSHTADKESFYTSQPSARIQFCQQPALHNSSPQESTKSWLGPGRRRAACPCSPCGTHESPSPPQTRSKG